MATRRGHEVARYVRHAESPASPASPTGQVITGTLENPPWPSIEAFAPDVVLHLAWISTPGEYLASPENERLLQQSRQFLARCIDMGVPHVAAAGTCIEYADSSAPLNEFHSALSATVPYSAAKAALCRWLETHMTLASGCWTWFRIFYPYGPGEHPQRLPTLLTRRLTAGQPVSLRTPASVKDYVFINDMAGAICLALEHKLAGPVNLGSGSGIRIRDIAMEIAHVLGADPALVTEAEPPTQDPWPVQVADVGRLGALGWTAATALTQGLRLLSDSLPPVRDVKHRAHHTA